jgi:PKD repeat protein
MPQCTFTLGLETNTMRFSPVLTVALGAALLAACGGDSTGPNPDNAAPTANFTFACSDLACTFTDRSADGDGTIASQAWTFGDGQTGTGAIATHTYAVAGTYNVTVKATDNGGASTTSQAKAVPVTAASPGGPSASFDASCTSLDCTITNTSTATGSVVTWAWTFGDGQTSTAEDPGTVHYTASAITTFTITLVVTSDGVTSQATKQVTVSPAATLTCNGVDCTLPVPAGATVVVTLVSHDCEAHGNKFVITQPAVDTLFTDGCFEQVGTPFQLNNGDPYTEDTDLAAEVLTGVAGTTSAQLRVTGDFASGWTLEFDDGFVGEGEPDFDDLVITVKATLP